MSWVLMIVVASGSVISASANFHNIPMQSKEACIRAAQSMQSSGIAKVCISQETGETIQVKP